jgi:hypothetical protein
MARWAIQVEGQRLVVNVTSIAGSRVHPLRARLCDVEAAPRADARDGAIRPRQVRVNSVRGRVDTSICRPAPKGSSSSRYRCTASALGQVAKIIHVLCAKPTHT